MPIQFKLGTLNLCQGLPSKKNLVKQTIIHEEIDLLFMLLSYFSVINAVNFFGHVLT